MFNMTILASDTHENVCKFEDDDTGLRCVIAVHSTKRGPALGGTRFWTYETDDDMLKDALALSEAMTYKNAAAELPYGGGKAVVNIKGVEKTPELLQAYARAVSSMNGTYITAEDVGCAPGDLEHVASFTEYCVRDCVSSSPATAFGVLQSMTAALEVFNIRRDAAYDLSHCSVVVQGAGNVGSLLAEMLVMYGAEVHVTDIKQEKVDALVAKIPSINQPAQTKKFVRIFAPCALGPAITGDNFLDMFTYDIICGAANNAVEKGLEEKLGRAGILYCPDFIANAGGVISIHHDIVKTPRENGLGLVYAGSDVAKIHQRTRKILLTNPGDTMKGAMDYAASNLT